MSQCGRRWQSARGISKHNKTQQLVLEEQSVQSLTTLLCNQKMTLAFVSLMPLKSLTDMTEVTVSATTNLTFLPRSLQ